MANPTLAQEQSMRAIQPSSPLIPPSMQQLTQAEKQISQQTGLTSKADIAAYLQEQARINEINARNKADYEKQLAEYNSQVATQNAIQRDLNLLRQYAEASGSSGTIRYDASVGSLIQGLMSKGLSEREIRDYYEGIASSQTAYQLASKYAGIRAEQKAIIAQLPKGEKPIWNTFGQLQGIESSALGRTFNLSGYNQAVQAQQIQQKSSTLMDIAPNAITFSMPFQKSGTAYMKPSGEFYTPTTTIRYDEKNIQTLSSFIPIVPLERLKTNILTPKSYMYKAGPYVSIVPATPKNIQAAKEYEKMGFAPSKVLEHKPSFPEKVAAGLIPTSVGQAGQMITLGLLTGGTYKLAPLVTSLGLSGFGGYSTYKYATTPASISGEKIPGETQAGYAAGTLGLLGLFKIGETGYDIYRTRGMTKIPAEKVVAPEVLAYYKGTEKGTRFPYDVPSTFKRWFETENIKKYGLPNIPKEVQGKPLGYSATTAGQAVEKAGIGTAGQFYSGKGVSVGFLRVGSKDSPNIGQDFMFGKSPYVYALYGEKTQVVPSAYEVKVPNPYEIGGKPIKKYIFPGIEKKPGVFYIPTNKPEVQAVAYGNLAPIRKAFYFNIGGRRVPIGEYVSAGGKIGEEVISKGAKAESVSPSILPSKSSGISSVISSLGISSPVLPSSLAVSYPKSKVSSIAPSISIIPSTISSISPSKSITPLSQISLISQPSQAVSQVSKVPASSYTFSFSGEYPPYRPPEVPIPIISRRRKEQKKKERAYKVYILKEATKPEKKRWQLVGAELPLITALSFGAEATSKDISRRFKVIPEAEEVQPKNIVVKTFEKLAPMFRSFSQKGGVKIALPKGEYIQKAPFSLSSKEERKQIQQARRNKLSAKLY